VGQERLVLPRLDDGAETPLEVVESVLRFVRVMTRSSPRVPPGVPAAGVESVEHHVLAAVVSTEPAMERVCALSAVAICPVQQPLLDVLGLFAGADAVAICASAGQMMLGAGSWMHR
jgi:hypothetical protein